MFFVATQVTSENESADIAKKLTECFKQSFALSTENVHITSSIGISMYPKDGSEIDDLLKNADVAMYRAKAEGRNRFHFFHPRFKSESSTTAKYRSLSP